MKKKSRNNLLFFLVILACIFLNNIYAYSSLTSYKPKYGSLTANVNFRYVASTSTGKIRILAKGTAVKMLGDMDSFYVVQLATNEIGVLSKAYVKTTTTAPKGALTYTSTGVKNVTVNANNVTLRGGPNTTFRKVTSLNKGTTLKSIGYIGNWYIVITSNNLVGCIRKDLLNISSTNVVGTTTPSASFTLSTDEQAILTLINNARVKAGIAKLTPNADLFKIARLKAIDMVKNSYFSHTSATYGSPFKMMSTYKITYKTAGENIAGNPSLSAAVTAWLNSNTHKQNILSNSYNYIGIGVEKSETYGYIIDTMFIR